MERKFDEANQLDTLLLSLQIGKPGATTPLDIFQVFCKLLQRDLIIMLGSNRKQDQY